VLYLAIGICVLFLRFFLCVYLSPCLNTQFKQGVQGPTFSKHINFHFDILQLVLWDTYKGIFVKMSPISQWKLSVQLNEGRVFIKSYKQFFSSDVIFGVSFRACSAPQYMETDIFRMLILLTSSDTAQDVKPMLLDLKVERFSYHGVDSGFNKAY